MDLQGERVINADRATVWQALNDPDTLRACIPGCESLEKTSDDTFEGEIVQKVGPVKARFKGKVTLSDVVEGESYRIDGEGKGGAAGYAKGGADVRLSDAEEGGTRLAFDASAKVGGKLAQLGNRLIDGFAQKMADRFFDNFKEEVEGPGGPDRTAPVDQASDDLVAEEASPAVAMEQAEGDGGGHPTQAPGAAGPTTRDEPITGASARPSEEPVGGPVATQEDAGPAGGTEAPIQAAMAKRSAEMAAHQDDPDAEAGRLEDDPAKGPPDRARDVSPITGNATPEPTNAHASANDAEEDKEKKGWISRLFGG